MKPAHTADPTWKAYEDNFLTHSAAHYLMAIRQLSGELGYARVTDIARRLQITRGSCSISLRPLKKRGLVEEDSNLFLRLSAEGARLAERVERNDALLERLLRDAVGVSAGQAEIDACKSEHLLSLETGLRLAHFLRFLEGPHPAARAFRTAFRRHRPSCTGNPRTCPVCRNACFQPPPEGAARPRADTLPKRRSKVRLSPGDI